MRLNKGKQGKVFGVKIVVYEREVREFIKHK